MTVKIWILSWNEGKTAKFRMFFDKAEAEIYALQHRADVGEHPSTLQAEVHGMPIIFACYDTFGDDHKHAIFLEKEPAEAFLQNSDSGRLDMRRHKIGEVF